MEVFIYLITAFSLGIFHAIEPGHGKLLVMAYLAGTKGNAYDAVWLGMIASIAHTITILILGAFATTISKYILPEHLEPTIELIAGIMVLFLGIWIIIRHWFKKETLDTEAHCCFDKQISLFKGKGTKHISELLTLGISGGIIPCSGAIAVLLTSLASGKLVYGFVMIMAFSIGLGSALIMLGILFVKASSHFRDKIKILEHKGIAFASGLLILFLGIYLIITSLNEILLYPFYF